MLGDYIGIRKDMRTKPAIGKRRYLHPPYLLYKVFRQMGVVKVIPKISTINWSNLTTDFKELGGMTSVAPYKPRAKQGFVSKESSETFQKKCSSNHLFTCCDRRIMAIMQYHEHRDTHLAGKKARYRENKDAFRRLALVKHHKDKFMEEFQDLKATCGFRLRVITEIMDSKTEEGQ
jgi:hypothetical protein